MPQGETEAPELSPECARCGHAQGFHEEAEEAGVHDGKTRTVCTSPEDGVACACEGFEPV